MQYRRAYLMALLLVAFPACTARYRTRLDCFEICKDKGLRLVELAEGIRSVDQNTGEVKAFRGCRCE